MDPYERIVHRNTEFFSTEKEDVLMQELIQYADSQGYKVTLAKDKFKAKVAVLLEGGEVVEIKANIMKVDENKVCVEFSKGGDYDSMKFYEEYAKIKEYMDDYNNATY